MSADDAKTKFEKEREKILSEIPSQYKAQFGQIAFAVPEIEDDDDEHDAVYMGIPRPVLVLNPYDIPPRPYRDVYWFSMFKGTKGKKGKPFQHVVYHYGNDLDDCYSFVETTALEYYDTAAEKGITELPELLQTKISTGVPLTPEEESWVRGVAEMKDDLMLEPAQRKRGLHDFQERHETTTQEPPKKKTKTKK